MPLAEILFPSEHKSKQATENFKPGDRGRKQAGTGRPLLNLSVRPETYFGSGLGTDAMSKKPNFRAWAARLASKVGNEPDPCESQRLKSIAEYWKRLADLDDWERDGFRPASEESTRRLS
jgi:hypothetical protein